jgi:Flp pilus assembly protein TadG
MTQEHRHRRRHQHTRDQRGEIAQVVLVFPAVLFVIMLIIQFALYAHAASVAEAAAQDGAAVARRADGTKAGAEAAANTSLDSLGPRMLSTRSVVATRTQNQASVTVTGKVVSLVPGVSFKIRETATGPVERYVPLSGGP